MADGRGCSEGHSRARPAVEHETGNLCAGDAGGAAGSGFSGGTHRAGADGDGECVAQPGLECGQGPGGSGNSRRWIN